MAAESDRATVAAANTMLFSNQSSTSSPSNTARKLSSVSARGIKEKSELSSVFWALSATDSA